MITKGSNNNYQRYNSVSNHHHHHHRQHGCCSHTLNMIHIMVMCLLGTLIVTFIIIYQFQSSLFDNSPTSYSSTVTMPSSMMINKQDQRLDSAPSSDNRNSSSNYSTVFDKFKRNVWMNHLNGPVDYKDTDLMKVSKGFYKDSKTIIELNEHSYRFIRDTTTSGSDEGSSSRSSSSQHTHPYMIVFYASWCGHCKSFVKPYSLIVTDVISEVNQRNLDIYYSNEVSHMTRYSRNQHDSKQYSSIDSNKSNGNGNGHGMDQVLMIYDTPVFSAINCVDYSSICEENKVTSYPTIIFYNFHNAAAVSREGEESSSNNSNNNSTSSSSSSSSSSSTLSSDLVTSSSNDPNQSRIEGARVSTITKFIRGTLYSRSSMVMITRKEFVEKYGPLINDAGDASGGGDSVDLVDGRANNRSSMIVLSAAVEDIGVVPRPSPHISHKTTPDLRWHDSIASLLYMLSHELPADLKDNPQAKHAVLRLLRTLLYLFPSRREGAGGEFNGLKSMLQQIVDIVDSNLKDSKLEDLTTTDSKSVVVDSKVTAAAGGRGGDDALRASIIKVIHDFRNSGNIQQVQQCLVQY